MSYMFNKCYKLKEIKGINIFNTQNVTLMNSMFQCCEKLTSLNVTNFNTSNVNDMSFMFNQCHLLKEIIGINNFDSINVTNMKAMFNECNSLISLDLKNFLTSKVNDMSFMFCKCEKLKYLNIEKFKLVQDCNTESLFVGLKKKCNIVINDKILKIIYSKYKN